MERKHVAIVTRALYGGGAERVIAQLANYFVANQKSCTIITLEDGEIQYVLDESVRVIPVGKKSRNKLLDKLYTYRYIRQVILQMNADVVLSMPEEVGIYTVLGMIGTKLPVIVSERNNPWVMPDVKITRVLRNVAYPFAQCIIFQTETAKSFFPQRIQRKSHVIPNPVDEARIPCQFMGAREKVIAAAGRLHTQKNFSLLIEAFQSFHKEHPDFRLVIYGEGSLREHLSELIREKHLEEAVELPGRSNDLLNKINSCAMFVLSSDYEGSPNVLIEAMCMGMPVIATDCPSGGPGELITDHSNGLLVPVGNAQALAAAMEEMADIGFADACGEKAYALRKTLTGKDVFARWKQIIFDEI